MITFYEHNPHLIHDILLFSNASKLFRRTFSPQSTKYKSKPICSFFFLTSKIESRKEIEFDIYAIGEFNDSRIVAFFKVLEYKQ